VARARAARESIMRFTQRSWIAWRGVPFIRAEQMNTVRRALTLTVNWN